MTRAGPNSLAGEARQLIAARRRLCERMLRKGESMEVEMKIRGLMMDPVTNMPIVVLKDVSGSCDPAHLGRHLRSQRHRARNREGLDAAADDPRPDQQPAARPRSRDPQGGGERAEGRHLLRRDLAGADGEMISVDSRPSDALALALRLDCPIYVDDTVLKTSQSCGRRVRKVQQRRAARAGWRT